MKKFLTVSTAPLVYFVIHYNIYIYITWIDWLYYIILYHARTYTYTQTQTQTQTQTKSQTQTRHTDTDTDTTRPRGFMETRKENMTVHMLCLACPLLGSEVAVAPFVHDAILRFRQPDKHLMTENLCISLTYEWHLIIEHMPAVLCVLLAYAFWIC